MGNISYCLLANPLKYHDIFPWDLHAGCHPILCKALLLLGRGLEALPWQLSSTEVDQHIASASPKKMQKSSKSYEHDGKLLFYIFFGHHYFGIIIPESVCCLKSPPWLWNMSWWFSIQQSISETPKTENRGRVPPPRNSRKHRAEISALGCVFPLLLVYSKYCYNGYC